MNNTAPYLFGKLCEMTKEQKRQKQKYNYHTRDELINMAELIHLEMTSQLSNQNICEAVRVIATQNNLNTYQEFENYILNLELGKYPSFDDFLMFQPGLQSLNFFFNGIHNINDFSQTIHRLGIPSDNGFLHRLTYNNNGRTLPVILKSNIHPMNDNLYHEYIAGQCINEFSKYFPFFPRTFALGMYNNENSWRMFHEHYGTFNILSTLSNYLNFLNPIEYDKNLKNSCSRPKHINIYLQFINIKCNLREYFNNLKFIKRSEINPLYQKRLTYNILILYLVYKTLSKLGDYFTHYDLHPDNVVIYEIPEQKYIELEIITDAGLIQLRTNCMPILIDFGRSYFNCENLKTGTLTSPNLMRNVCKYDNRNPIVENRFCANNCGDEKGYGFFGNLNPDGTIRPTDHKSYWINRGMRNISHDLRLMGDLKQYISLSRLNMSIPYINQFNELLGNIHYRGCGGFGMPEIPKTVLPMDPINNIHDVANYLENIIILPEFKTDLYQELSLTNPNNYGTLYLDFSSNSFDKYRFVKH
jgi:hypothetical protein